MAPRARVQKRLYYKIGEACKALGIQPYVLRYWETEFPALSPSKSRSGQRVYSEKELEVIRRIKELLYDEGYTIAGAKKKLESELAAGSLGEAPSSSDPAPPPVLSGPDATEAEGVPWPLEASAIPAGHPGAARVTGPAGAAGTLGLAGDPDPAIPAESAAEREPAGPRLEPGSRRLDTGAAQRIQTLRTGIQQALQEARVILALLDS